MKKLTTIAMALMMLTGCSAESDETKDKYTGGRTEYTGGVYSEFSYAIDVQTVDSCEYIICYGSKGRTIIHKANCKNPFHDKCKQLEK